MTADLDLMEWARRYVVRARAEQFSESPGTPQPRIAVGPALRAYQEESGKEAPERLWVLVDMWRMQPSEVLAVPYLPAAQADTGPITTSASVNLEYAGLLCRKSCGHSPGRCSWHTDTATQCPEPVPDSEFFCPAHVTEMEASDADVRATWNRFRAEVASYRELFHDGPTPQR